MSSNTGSRPLISPSQIERHIAFEECPRYLKLRIDDQGEQNKRNWNEAFQPVSVLLSGTGGKFEQEVESNLRQDCRDIRNAQNSSSKYTVPDKIDKSHYQDAISSAEEILEDAVTEVSNSSTSKPLVIRECCLAGEIGVFSVAGFADIVMIWPGSDDEPIEIRVFEIKSSWKEKTSHRLQAAIYAELLSSRLNVLKSISDEIKITAGVIFRKTEINNAIPDELPIFDLPLVEGDVARIFRKDGKIDQIYQDDIEEVGYQLNQKCEGCIHNESCYTRAVESRDISILGLSRGEQEVFREQDIHTIDQIAQLKQPPDNSSPKSYTPLEPVAGNQQIVDKLVSDPTIGNELDDIVRRAQVMLGELNPGHNYAYTEYDSAQQIGGKGYLEMPAASYDVPFEPSSYDPERLLRIYINVQWDYMRDSIIMMSARVEAEQLEPKSVAEVDEDVNPDPQQAKTDEKELLDTFFKKLYGVIQGITSKLYDENQAIGGQQDCVEPQAHVYFYSQLERKKLLEAIRRHPSIVGAQGVRDLLGLRRGIDEHMTTIIEDQVETYYALHSPSTGLLPVLDEIPTRKDKIDYRNNEVTAERPADYLPWKQENAVFDSWSVAHNNKMVELDDVFSKGLFNYWKPYTTSPSPGSTFANTAAKPRAGTLKFRFDHQQSQDDFFPLHPRYGSQIPLEYFWCAADQLNMNWLDNPQDQNRERIAIERYTYYDRSSQNNEIDPELIKKLGKKFTGAVAAIERSLWNKDGTINKERREIHRPDFTLGDLNLSRSAQEYLELEYSVQRQEALERHAKAPRQRVQTGRSTVFRLTDVQLTSDGDLQLYGELAYDELGYADPEQVMNMCRLKEPGDSSSGSFVTLNRIEQSNGFWEHRDQLSPEDIDRGISGTVEELDYENQEILIELSQFNDHQGDAPGAVINKHRDFHTWGTDWSLDPDDADDSSVEYIPGLEPTGVMRREEDDAQRQLGSFGSGSGNQSGGTGSSSVSATNLDQENIYFIVDKQTDDVTSLRTSDALDHDTSNTLINRIEKIQQGNQAVLSMNQYHKNAVEDEFLPWVETTANRTSGTAAELDNPNEKQRDFIKRTDESIVSLQGPPGTGKTAGAMAYAIAGRLYDRTSHDEPFVGVVTGFSNKAVNELLEDTATTLRALENHSGDAPTNKGQKSVTADHTAFDSVDLYRISSSPIAQSKQFSNVEYINYNEDEQKVQQVAKNLRGFVSTGLSGSGSLDRPQLFFLTPSGISKFFNKIGDIYSGDTGSGTGSHYTENFYNFLAVDESSMLPMPQFFLTGTFLTDESQVLLSGDHRQMPPVQIHEWEEEDRRTIEQLAPYLSISEYVRFINGNKELENVSPPASAVPIPVEQLEQTYRCHSDLAEFLYEWVYSDDDLPYSSQETATFSGWKSTNRGVSAILDEDHPITVVLHDDTASKQESIVERELANELADATTQTTDVGVVTPHNAQRGSLKSTLTDKVKADTVERFQGGEKDLIMISSTVGDRDQVRKETEFLLNANRLNVAVSRMKKKLVVLVSRSVFEVFPEDAETYDETRIWRGLLDEVNATEDIPRWQGQLSDIVSSPTRDVSIEVYPGD